MPIATLPVVSAVTAGILIIMQMILMVAVVRARIGNRQSLGDGGHADLERAIRRHGNFAENAAIFIAGFTLLELLGASRLSLTIMCAVFVLGRISHIVGLSLPTSVNAFRRLGIVATVLVGSALGVRLIVSAWGLF
jgi:uncharacterized membrane protein YecN with MAPEG domain